MIFDYRKCLIHNEPIYFICTKNHDCAERRLCPFCINENHIPIQITVVKDRLVERLLALRNEQQISLFDLKSLEFQANEALNELRATTKAIFPLINNIDNQIEEISVEVLDKNKEILDFQNKAEYDRIIQIIEDQTLITRMQQNQMKILEIKKTISYLAEQFSEVVQKTKGFSNNIFKKKKDCNFDIEGPTVLGMKNGDYFYHIGQDVYFAGKYEFDEKIGNWMKYIKSTKQISFKEYQKGGKFKKVDQFGLLNQNNNKEGWWLEQLNQTKTYGKYINGIKVGNWSLFNKDGIKWQVTFIHFSGGGKYSQQGQKIELWTDVDDQYCISNPIQYIGEYQSNFRVGKWEILQIGILIGYGELDNKFMKQNYWKEINATQNKTTIYTGNYVNGFRQGKWSIFESQNLKIDIREDAAFLGILISEGSFDDSVKKTGLWNDYIQNGSIETGQYVADYRQGKWKATRVGKLLWEGQYLDNQKTGRWVYYEENLKNYQTGEYQADQRIGIWQVYHNGKLRLHAFNNYRGEGEFHENGIKKGQWTEYSEDSKEQSIGKYFCGKRSGKWIVYQDRVKIAEGEFNELNQKHGQWVEYLQIVDQESVLIFFQQEVTLNLKLTGQYSNGKKVGFWRAQNFQNGQEIIKYSMRY